MDNQTVPRSKLIVTEELLEEFTKWLHEEEGTSESTIRKYMYYLPKLTGFIFSSKADVSKAFELMGYTKVSREALSRLFTFVERKLEGYEGLVYRLRKAMPKAKRSRMDTYVPPDTKVLELGKCLAARGPVYSCIYNILVSTGCRGIEARFILGNADKLRVVELPYEVVRIHLPGELQRGSKNEYVVYMPKQVWLQILKLQGTRIPHEDTIEKAFKKCGLNLKYIRKWWRQKAKQIGLDSENIEAFQGRITTIGGKHYTDWIPILDQDYKKIKQTIEKFIIYY